MSNKEFIDLYDQTRENYNKLHNMVINAMSVWFVDCMGRRQSGVVVDCHDFNTITTKGTVAVIGDYGVWLKITDKYWVNVANGVDSLVHDLDILKFLITKAEDGDMATIIDPGE